MVLHSQCRIFKKKGPGTSRHHIDWALRSTDPMQQSMVAHGALYSLEADSRHHCPLHWCGAHLYQLLAIPVQKIGDCLVFPKLQWTIHAHPPFKKWTSIKTRKFLCHVELPEFSPALRNAKRRNQPTPSPLGPTWKSLNWSTFRLLPSFNEFHKDLSTTGQSFQSKRPPF